jgi:hypothetical protein
MVSSIVWIVMAIQQKDKPRSLQYWFYGVKGVSAALTKAVSKP